MYNKLMKVLFRKSNKYNIGIICIAVLAIIIRLLHLFYNQSFYGDEIALYNNIRDYGYIELLKGLHSVQAAPPVFLLIEKFVFELYKNQTQFIIDFSLRLLPFICGVLSIFAFYKFNKLVLEEKRDRVISFLIFTINTQSVAYCAIFKQYSMELLVAIILLIISFKIIFQNTYKWYYMLIIAFAIWFSYSSVFILLPLFIYILFKKKEVLKQIILPLLISSICLYNFSIKYILSSSYIAMKNCWEGLDIGYIDLYHPTRIFIRFGEFFVFGATTPNKILTIFCGLLIVCLIIMFILSKNKYKYFLVTPILLVISASIFHKYPIVARLILFLWPLISIIIASYHSKFKKTVSLIMCFIAVLSCLYYVPSKYNSDIFQRNQIEYFKGYLNLTQ